MSPIFEHNLNCLQQHFPELVHQLPSLQHNAFNLALQDGRTPTLLVNGRQLTSAHDRLGQAAYALRDINLNHDLNLIGWGLGDEARIFLEKSGCSVSVQLINPGLFYLLLGVDDEMETLISNPRLKLALIADPENWQLPDNSVIIVPELYLDESYANSIKQRLKLKLDERFSHDFHLRQTAYIKKRIAAQADFLACEVPYRPQELPALSKAVILASGPSLEERIGTVKELAAHGYTTICADTALPYLTEQGLIPHYTLSVDIRALPQVLKKIKTDAPCFKKTKLIYEAGIDAACVSSFSHRYFIFSPLYTHAAPALVKPLSGLLDERGSVLISAVSFALKQGAQEIYLCGADFCYKGAQSHAGLKAGDCSYTGAVKPDLSVRGNDGQLHLTQRNFLCYKYLLEEIIAANPQVNFYNLSPFGAQLKGAPLQIRFN